MGGNPEKRFQSIMDKLFHAPKPVSDPSSCSGVQLWSGRKRPRPESALALVEPKTSQLSTAPPEAPPLCRPWDRGDLMRRLATFKSMTWFAKPKVASAVNCARRGWINVDMDIIACESCGARLLFSTPSAWPQQQVEKAALVFSSKLDSGHKLLCPWNNNACDERLTEFPPTTPPVLVDKFRERSSALLQLSALPVISSSAVEYMRSPQLEEFLRVSSTLENGNGSAGVALMEFLGNESEAASANLYYQAQKLIGLCGWEPRLLPYIVDNKDGPNQPSKIANFLNISHMVTNGQHPSVSVPSATIHQSLQEEEECRAPAGLNADPNSVVLDCKLCGASVGLWTFSMVPRPVELLRLVGYTEVNGKKSSEQDTGNDNHVDAAGNIVDSASHAVPSNLKLTIAGGPPPTKQSFKAMISFPVIGQNLRAKISYDSDFRDRTCNNPEDARSVSQNRDLLLKEKDAVNSNFGGQISQSETVGLLSNQTYDQGQSSHGSRDESPCFSLSTSEENAALTMGKDVDVSLEGSDVTRQGTASETCLHDSVMECPTHSTPDIVQDSAIEVCGSSQVGVASEICLNITDTSQEGIKDREQMPVNNELVAYGAGKDLKQLSVDNAMEFDPIRQHRHFCPWIVSTSGGAPGWQQTLSALQRQKEHHSPNTSPSSSSMIKVDNPITSVRKLFMSPSAKRMKPASAPASS